MAGSHPVSVIPPTEFVFPVSKRSQTRRLVLRNVTANDLVVKLRTSCPEAVHIQRRNVLVHANEWLAIPVTLMIEKMRLVEELRHQTIAIYCRSAKALRRKAVEWFMNDADDTLYLALTLKVSRLVQLQLWVKIARTSGFSAPDTVMDLPGMSTLLETPPYPTFDVDDSDCLTARRFDSDTATATEICEEDFAAVMPDSLIDTAHDVVSDMKTAYDVNYQPWCSVGRVLNVIYPVGGSNNQLPTENNRKWMIMPCGN